METIGNYKETFSGVQIDLIESIVLPDDTFQFKSASSPPVLQKRTYIESANLKLPPLCKYTWNISSNLIITAYFLPVVSTCT